MTQTKDKKKVKLTRKEFVKEHKHLVTVLKKGSEKDKKKEARDQEEELQDEQKKIKGVKSTAIRDEKDNYEKRPSAKYRRTSTGFMKKG